MKIELKYRIVFLVLIYGLINHISTAQRVEDVNDADSPFIQAKAFFNKNNLNQAEEYARKAIGYYVQNQNIEMRIESMIFLAEILYFNDKYNELNILLNNIGKDLKNLSSKRDDLEIKYLYVKLSYYRYTDSLELCNTTFNQITGLLPLVSLESGFKARLYRQIGNYFLFTTSQYYKAEKNYDSALYYINKPSHNIMEEFKCHWCLGQSLTLQKKYIHGKEHLIKCEKLYHEYPLMFKIHIAYVYSFMIEISGSLNDESMLNIYFKKLKETFYAFKDSINIQTEREKFQLNYVLAFINMSKFYIKSEKPGNALDILKKAETEIRSFPQLLYYIYDQQAWLYLTLKDYDNAELYAHKLLKSQQKEHSFDLQDTYYLLSDIEGKKENFLKQKEFINKALKCRNISNILMVKLLTNLGECEMKLNNHKQALNTLNESIQINIGYANIDSINKYYKPEITYDSDFLFKALFLKGQILNILSSNKNKEERMKLIIEADKYLKYCIDMNYKYLSYLQSDYDIKDELDDKRNRIKQYISFVIEAYEFSKDFDFIKTAFKYIERSKATTLNLNFVENKAKIYGGIPDFLIKQENELNNKISDLLTDIKLEKELTKSNEQVIHQLTDSLYVLKSQKNTLINILEENYKEYYNLKYSTNIINIDEIQFRLKGNQAIIEYYMIDDFLFSFFISQSNATFIRQNISTDFYNKIKYVREYIESNEIDKVSRAEYNKFVLTSYQLYLKLINPFKEVINKRSLIIIPDNIISALPFDVLLIDSTLSSTAFDYKPLNFLIKNNPISYAYSASVLFKDKFINQTVNNIIAFAPVKYPDKSIQENLKLISGTEDELNAIAQIFPTKKYLKSRATESNFKKIINDKSILHLALHTLVNENNSLYSKMVFYPDQLKKDDGLLYAYEIYNLNFKSPLVVLSSCQSGYGEFNRGEGYKSLAWAFKYAGIPSVVMTMWKVSDNASSILIKKFYHYLKEEYSKEIALQKAKLDYLNSCDPLKSDPYYWSSFNLIGNTESLQIEHSVNYKYIFFILTYLLVLVIFLIRIKKIQKDDLNKA